MFSRVLDSLANVLPSETQYHQLQQQQLLLSTHTPARVPTVVIDLEQPMPMTLDAFRPSQPMNARRAEITRTVKATLEEPLTDGAVSRSWHPVYFMTSVALGAVVILALVVWYLFW